MMSDCGDRLHILDGERNTESPKASSDLGTRPRTLSRKALQNATERKRHVVSTLHDKLKHIIQSVFEEKQAHNVGNILNDLITITKDLKAALIELENLYANENMEIIKEKHLSQMSAVLLIVQKRLSKKLNTKKLRN